MNKVQKGQKGQKGRRKDAQDPIPVSTSRRASTRSSNLTSAALSTSSSTSTTSSTTSKSQNTKKKLPIKSPHITLSYESDIDFDEEPSPPTKKQRTTTTLTTQISPQKSLTSSFKKNTSTPKITKKTPPTTKKTPQNNNTSSPKKTPQSKPKTSKNTTSSKTTVPPSDSPPPYDRKTSTAPWKGNKLIVSLDPNDNYKTVIEDVAFCVGYFIDKTLKAFIHNDCRKHVYSYSNYIQVYVGDTSVIYSPHSKGFSILPFIGKATVNKIKVNSLWLTGSFKDKNYYNKSDVIPALMNKVLQQGYAPIIVDNLFRRIYDHYDDEISYEELNSIVRNDVGSLVAGFSSVKKDVVGLASRERIAGWLVIYRIDEGKRSFRYLTARKHMSEQGNVEYYLNVEENGGNVEKVKKGSKEEEIEKKNSKIKDLKLEGRKVVKELEEVKSENTDLKRRLEEMEEKLEESGISFKTNVLVSEGKDPDFFNGYTVVNGWTDLNPRSQKRRMFDRIMLDTLKSSCKTTYELEGTRALSEEQECIVEAMIDTVKLDVKRNALQPSALTSKCTHAEMVAIANIVKFKNGYANFLLTSGNKVCSTCERRMRIFFGEKNIRIRERLNTQSRVNNWCVEIKDGGGLITEKREERKKKKEEEGEKGKKRK
mmetsp:Transcript_14605/g.26986  ORF Transcript_14605/g.26986 Transcript_14605/m.26986 type:complete len:651 (-) Transcript_14605:32-1984(-)